LLRRSQLCGGGGGGGDGGGGGRGQLKPCHCMRAPIAAAVLMLLAVASALVGVAMPVAHSTGICNPPTTAHGFR
jgi:hypothetical protein